MGLHIYPDCHGYPQICALNPLATFEVVLPTLADVATYGALLSILTTLYNHVQVSAAEQKCVSSTERFAHLQHLADEQAGRLQAAEVAIADSNARLAAASSNTGELQRQLSLAVQQRDSFSNLANDRSA